MTQTRRAVIDDADAPAKASPAPGERGAFAELFSAAADHCNLPAFPAAAARAISLTRDPDVNLDEVARAVGHDPGLAARVLRISRSALLSLRTPPSTLPAAIKMVGLGTVQQLLTTASARSLLSPNDPVASRLWDHLLATAMACDELGVRAGRPRGGDHFLGGLFHDIGRLIFHLSDPRGYTRCGHADLDAEKALFQSNHAVVSGALVFKWELEPAIAEAILEHHAHPLPPGLATDIARADWIAHRIGYGSTDAPLETLYPADSFDVAPLEEMADHVQQVFEAERELFS